MNWQNPRATDPRFGFDITMYVANRWVTRRQHKKAGIARFFSSTSSGVKRFCRRRLWRPEAIRQARPGAPI
ncbi:MAG: hypothetical protein KKD25_16470 [Gammaproteobacteria bacterium]|jgi:hypothetical protein|nr:hypothetical protein [Gammaproteobacteria bacterium]MBU0771179.1 hypothetical protein [Gammaproteobacteria bacterium]MBU0855907.1 hypothetical protein [Gammaproteobacteria bacterium]MBU1849008.1 hypothetical protein [Gammaproteobacteria bacterium]